MVPCLVHSPGFCYEILWQAICFITLLQAVENNPHFLTNPPLNLKKSKKRKYKKKIFLKNIEIRRFFIASVGALCLEYRFYAIFCFKAATLALETKKMAKSDIFERAIGTRQYKAHSPLVLTVISKRIELEGRS